MKKTFKIKGMNCNSCAMLIEKELKENVNHVSASYAKEQAEVDFDENKISEKEVKDKIEESSFLQRKTSEKKAEEEPEEEIEEKEESNEEEEENEDKDNNKE